MALKSKIKCNGLKPTKSEVYKLAAELTEIEGHRYFKSTILETLLHYDYDYEDYYYDDDYDYDYYDDYYADDYADDYYDDYYDYNYDYNYDLSQAEKVIALLFLSAMCTKE